MKIILLIHKPQARGQELFASLLGNHLIEKGHEVMLISIYSGDFILPFVGKQIHLGLESSRSTFIPTYWKKISKLIREFQPDIIQANGGDTLKFAVLSKLLFPYSGLLLFNNGGVVSYYLDSWIKRYFYKFLLAKIDGAISISQHAARDLKKLVPNNCPQTQIPIAVESNRNTYPTIQSENQVFVHIGGFTREKNHREMILLFSDFLKLNPSAQLWMIGDGPFRQEIERIAAEISSESFRFFGALSDPWKVVPVNSILLLPSLIEGMPSVIAEAMYAKIPVIAYGVGGIPEMVSFVPSCHLIQPGDSAAFLQAMIDLTNENKQELDQKLEASKSIALKRFSMEKVSAEFANFYQSLCE